MSGSRLGELVLSLAGLGAIASVGFVALVHLVAPKVLSIASTFPAVIPPWKVAHLHFIDVVMITSSATSVVVSSVATSTLPGVCQTTGGTFPPRVSRKFSPSRLSTAYALCARIA